MLISQKNPSSNWEAVPVEASGQVAFWVWYRPAAIPSGLTIAIPSTLFADARFSPILTLRQLVARTQLDPALILCWTIAGITYDAAGGASPLLDQVLPAPQPGTNLEVTVLLNVLPAAAWPPVPAYPNNFGMAQPTQPTGSGLSQEELLLLDAIESNWKDVLALEVRVAGLRKDIGQVTARLSSLNRDLTSHERLVCTTKDLGEWSDCRRGLRDAMTVMARSIKEIDLGTTSGAGRRHQFEEIHQNHVVRRMPFPGIRQAVNEFETYRKILQSVISAAQASLNRGGRDAEMKASSFLQRVHAKTMSKRKESKFLFSKSFPPPGG